MRRSRIVLGTATLSLLALSVAIGATLVQPDPVSFSDVEGDTGQNTVVVITGEEPDEVEHVELDVITYADGTDNDGDWFRATRSDRGSNQNSVDLGKDAEGALWTEVDNCIVGSGAEGYTDNDGAFHPGLRLAGGTEYRVGPFEPVDSGMATLASDIEIAVPSQITAVRFLTGPNHAPVGTPSGSYEVAFKYANASENVTVTGIEIKHRNTTDPRSGSGTGWIVTNVGNAPTDTGCDSPSTSPIDEVIVSDPKPTQTLVSVTISYISDGPPAEDTDSEDGDEFLRGPIAVALDIASGDYEALYNDGTDTFYEGRFDATGASLSQAPDLAIWYGVSWNETVTDLDGVPLGDIRLDVICGDLATGVTVGEFSSTIYEDVPGAVNALDLGGDTEASRPADVFCWSEDISYSAFFEAYFDASPTLDGVTLHYTLDSDGDGYGYEPISFGDYTFAADCDPTNANCNVDCDTDDDVDGIPDCRDGCIDYDGDGFGLDNPDCEGSTDCSAACEVNEGFTCDQGTHPGCRGSDIDDTASSCTDNDVDADNDGVLDCRDLCIDVDTDGFGADNGGATLGTDADPVADCVVDHATPTPTACDFSGSAAECHASTFDCAVDATSGPVDVTSVCRGGDVDDTASSCTQVVEDDDDDNVLDCRDQCLDADQDTFGTTQTFTCVRNHDLQACDYDDSALACDDSTAHACDPENPLTPDCRGNDVDDKATSCTDSPADVDQDQVLDCRDKCIDADLDRYGFDNRDTSYGGTHTVTSCVTDTGGSCGFGAAGGPADECLSSTFTTCNTSDLLTPNCRGGDVDDLASTCTQTAVDVDGDGVVDCRDACFDYDGDGFGAANGGVTGCTGGSGTTGNSCPTPSDACDGTPLAACPTPGNPTGEDAALLQNCRGSDIDDTADSCTTVIADVDGDDVLDCRDQCLDKDLDRYGVAQVIDCESNHQGAACGYLPSAQECHSSPFDCDTYSGDIPVPDCYGGDVDDNATSCTTLVTDVDDDDIVDCRDLCLDQDFDEYGEDNDQAQIGANADLVGACEDATGDACDFTGTAAACETSPFDCDEDGSALTPNCRGGDVDDQATSCTTQATDEDYDNVLDCRDRCLDKDRDTYGDDRSNATVGEGAVAVEACEQRVGGQGCVFAETAQACATASAYTGCDTQDSLTPNCLGGDVDDTANSCTTSAADLDLDGTLDCRDLCLDRDLDRHGVGNGDVQVGVGNVLPQACQWYDQGTLKNCTMGDDAIACVDGDCYDNPDQGPLVNLAGVTVDPSNVHVGANGAVCGDGVDMACETWAVCTSVPCTLTLPDPELEDDDGDGLNNVTERDTHGTDVCNPDTDDDGLTDFREVNGQNASGTPHGFGPTNPLSIDTDNDGIRDLHEILGRRPNNTSHGFGATNPNASDSDGDALTDSMELHVTSAVSPSSATSDGGDCPGTYAWCNVAISGTDTGSTDWIPFVALMGLTANNTNPNSVDSDLDGLCDGAIEVTATTADGPCLAGEDLNANGHREPGQLNGALDGESNPTSIDTDGDGLCDHRRAETPTTCTDSERTLGTRAWDVDSDDDGLCDGTLVVTTGSFGTCVGSEVTFNTNPLSPDTDTDGLCDGPRPSTHHPASDCIVSSVLNEFDLGTNPNLQDSDNDGLSDFEEVTTLCQASYNINAPNVALCANPNAVDSDGDTVPDAIEATVQCDPDAPSARSGSVSGVFPLRVFVPADCDDANGASINIRDNDDDGDGVSTAIEVRRTGPGATPTVTADLITANFPDRDQDSVPNYLDVDDDGDTVLTINEHLAPAGYPNSACGDGTTSPEADDLDGDGWPNYLDPDDDGDFSVTFRLANGESATPDFYDPSDLAYTAPTRFELAAGTNPCGRDSDSDSVIDGIEFGVDPANPRDTDGDKDDTNLIPLTQRGIDALDQDDDNDGLATIFEDDGTGMANADAFEFDNEVTQCAADAVPNYLDLDSDNDGVCDYLAESGGSLWVNGVRGGPTCLAFNDENLVRPGISELVLESHVDDYDMDFVPNIWDCDDNDGGAVDTDLDGLLTNFENRVCMVGECPTGVNGLERPCPDNDEEFPAGFCEVGVDTLCCLNGNITDTDGDCVNDGDELGPLNMQWPHLSLKDTDGDGIPDVFDRDDDGDNVLTMHEYYDLDESGDFQFLEDRTLVRIDPSTCDPRINNTNYFGPMHIDTDGDGVPDFLDIDDDGDGLTTLEEDRNGNGDPSDVDSDDDWIPDYLDARSDGPCGDLDGDGILNNIEDELGLEGDHIDSDGDGVPDHLELWKEGTCAGPHLDAFEFDPSVCGVDYEDACLTVACCPAAPNTNGGALIDALDDDDDGDGIPTAVEGAFDVDGDGVPNYLDDDSNGDGIPDSVEGLVDSDGDGIPDFLDMEFDYFDDGTEPPTPDLPEPGCACSSAPSAPGASLWGLLFAAGLLARRRRRAA